MKDLIKFFYLLHLFLIKTVCFADVMTMDSSHSPTKIITKPINNPIAIRAKEEDKLPPNYFAIGFYNPTYILPYYYTGSPDYSIYQNNTPDDEKLKNAEFKYQFSFKVPVWKRILNHETSLFLAYTQLSYWQFYNKKAFFRESDYQPEVFLENRLNFHLTKNWYLNFFNIGVSHESNGYGNSMERSWNRIYFEANSSINSWFLTLKPWYVISTNANNNIIEHYLGYGQLILGYGFNKQLISLKTYNIIESQGRRVTAEIAWSFPLTSYIKGYMQVFSGYGQSLIEYDHRTNSAGIGIALSDWV